MNCLYALTYNVDGGDGREVWPWTNANDKLRFDVSKLAQWERDGVTAPVVAVNLSASQFAASTLLTDIDRILAQCGTRADRLELELTESAGMRDPQGSVALMTQLRQRGLKISIDDFGTGYSSLSYLKRFPVNRLKVDQSFVRDIVTDADDQAIARAIIAMGHQLKLEVVAEGVETGDQCALLTAAGCDLGQGYLMSRPVAAEQCAALFGKPLPLC